MKKVKFLFGALIMVLLLGIWGCAQNDNGNNGANQNQEEEKKEEEEEGKVRIDLPTDKPNAEVYLAITNLGDATVYNSEYKDILKPRNSRSAIESQKIKIENAICNEHDFSHYTCGLRIKTIRDSYNMRLQKNYANRSILRDQDPQDPHYDRTKYQKAATVDATQEPFWIIRTQKINGKEVDVSDKIYATCRYVNDDCQIFVEDKYYEKNPSDPNALYTSDDSKDYPELLDTRKLTKKGAQELAEKFSSIYKPEQAMLGSASLNEFDDLPYIIKTPERITILVSNLGYSENGGMVLGYFYGNDIFCNCDKDGKFYNDDKEFVAFSNQRLMFTLNSIGFWSGTDKNGNEYKNEEEMYSTLGHEFNHMLNSINKWSSSGDSFNESWFTEMLSAITEDFIPDYLEIPNTVQAMRLPYFLDGTEQGMVNWYGNDDVMYSYGYAYAFSSYLIRNYGGVKLLHEIATNNYYGKKAINEALKACNQNETYETVLEKFALTLLNIKGTITDAPTFNKDASGTIDRYTFNFNKIDLSKFPTVSGYGPFYTYEENPDCIYGGGFYVKTLGTVKELGSKIVLTEPENKKLRINLYVAN